MSLELLISPSVPILEPDDTGERALAAMEENRYTQLPLVADDHYVALIQEADMLDWNRPESTLGASQFLNYKPAVAASAHPFEAIKLANQLNLCVLPVIDNEHRYLGAITRETLVKYIAENSGISTPGGIITLEIAPRNYSLYEIARICENEDVAITTTQVHTNERGMLEVTLKLNRTALDGVVSSFERHKYKVTEVFGDIEKDENITSKYQLLMNYINM